MMNLEMIKFFQKLDNIFFVDFVKFLNFFDCQEFFFILIPFIWILFGSKPGLRLFYILMISSFTNKILKIFFAIPRPFYDDSTVGIIHVSGYGFPSGAAQTSVLLAGLLIASWKSPWRWPVALFYVLLISFSRVYLGVHYPLDILGGWVVGCVLLAVYFTLFPAVESILRKEENSKILMATIVVMGLLIACFSSPSVIHPASGAIGLALGVFLSQKGKISFPKRNWLEKLWIDFPIALGGICLIYVLIHSFLYNHSKLIFFMLYSLMGFWLSFCTAFISRKIPVLAKKR